MESSTTWNNRVCIIGIDPGSTTLGVGVITINTETDAIVSTEAFTLHADKISGYTGLEESHGDRIRRLAVLTDTLEVVFFRYNPVMIGSESPFYNRFRPNAYGVLVETIGAIRAAAMRYSSTIVPRMIDPPTVKNALGAKGNAKKEAVQAALLKLEGMHPVIPFTELDEHSVDAIGVAYACYKRYLEDSNHV